MLNKRLRFLGALIVVFQLAIGDSVSARMVTSFGNSYCEEWNVAYEEARSKKQFANIRSLGMKSWLMGYVSALNSSSLSDTDLLDNLDSRVIEDWVHKYCRENPKDSVSDAAQKLIAQLTKLTKKKKSSP